jgi:hypothetical protein
MRYYNRDGELDGRTFDRSYGTEAAMVLSGLDCALNGRRVVYGSSELTTGRRFWALARRHGVATTGDLRARLGEEEFDRLLWQPNLAAANGFARRLEERLGRLVVTPAPFLAPDWSQPEYLAFWETLIRTRIEVAYFNDGWEYSNGCAFELAVATDAGLATCDAQGRVLEIEEGIARVRSAIAEIEGDGLHPEGLRRGLVRLEDLAAGLGAAAESRRSLD